MTIPVGFGQVLFRFEGEAVPTGAAVTFGFEHSGTFDVDDKAATFATIWDGSLLNQQMNTINLVEVLVKLGPDDTGPTGAWTGVFTGSLTGETCPPNVAALIQKRTALGGRRNRGRIYLPALRETQIHDDGVVDSAYLDELQNVATIFLGDMDTEGNPLVILHSGSGAPTPITALNVDGRVATQRRRLRR